MRTDGGSAAINGKRRKRPQAVVFKAYFPESPSNPNDDSDGDVGLDTGGGTRVARRREATRGAVAARGAFSRLEVRQDSRVCVGIVDVTNGKYRSVSMARKVT